jgi:hypothetical protein
LLAVALLLGACDNSLKLLKPVDDARAAVKARFGGDWNITLPIVNGSGDAAIVCGYTDPPHAPGAGPPLSDDRLFIYADRRLLTASDLGKTALGDRADKDCKGLLRVKTVAPRHLDLGPR